MECGSFGFTLKGMKVKRGISGLEYMAEISESFTPALRSLWDFGLAKTLARGNGVFKFIWSTVAPSVNGVPGDTRS